MVLAARARLFREAFAGSNTPYLDPEVDKIRAENT